MKRIALLIIVAIIITQSSCVTTLQSLATFNTLTTDDRLVGKWGQEGQEFIVQKFFNSNLYKKHKDEIEKERKENGGKLDETMKRDSVFFSKNYVIEYIKNGIKYDLLGAVVKLNGQLFMSFKAEEMSKTDTSGKDIDLSLDDRIVSNTIARIQMINANTIQLDFIDGGFVYDQVKAGHMKIKHENDDLYGTFLITASSEQLQQFLEKYGKESRFFNKENSVTLIRKS